MWVITALYWAMLLTGLFTSGAFLTLHRPHNWFRARAVNATGWVIMIFILFLRAVGILVLKQTWVPQFESNFELGFSLVLGYFVDFLLIVRLKSFLAFRKDPQGYLERNRHIEDAPH